MIDKRIELEHIGDKLKTYLIGSMEDSKAKDEGKGWRNYIRPKLEERNIHVFDPTIGEEQRIGMSAKDFHEKLKGLVASGHWNEFTDMMNKIWKGFTYTNEKGELIHIMGDKDYVEHSDLLTCHIEKGDILCGTHGETYQAWLFGKPTYLITECSKKELSKSFLYWILDSGGEVFNSWASYLEYIDRKYKDRIVKLKRKEN